MKKFMLVSALGLMLTACGNEKSNSSGEEASPPPAPAEAPTKTETNGNVEIDPAKVLQPVKPGDTRPRRKSNPQAHVPAGGLRGEKGGEKKTSPASVRPPAQPQPSRKTEYISLMEDGLLASLKAQSLRYEDLNASRALAASLKNGKMWLDPDTTYFTLKREEGGKIRNYNFMSSAADGKLTRMSLYHDENPRLEGREDIRASIVCMDLANKCSVAVVKVAQPAGNGKMAVAWVVMRRQVADLFVNIRNPESYDRNLQVINRFFINSEEVYEGEDQVDMAYVESFEVAHGKSIVRTLIYGKNGELMAYTGDLTFNSYYKLNEWMRPLDVGAEDIDQWELRHRTTQMALMVESAVLSRTDRKGGVIVDYQLRHSGEEFSVGFHVRAQSLRSIEGLLK